MTEVGAKLAEAVHQGDFFCEVCVEWVDMDGARGFDEARKRVLSHAEEHE